jgi:hypothetical protein
VLVVLGDWPGAQVEFRTVEMMPTGLTASGPAAGPGHLTGRRGTASAVGRATTGRTRVVRLWLADRNGRAQPSMGEPAHTASSTTAMA